MIICSNCKKELEDGTRFCDGCGTQIHETIYCPNCGKQTSTEFEFCQSCGSAINESAAKPVESVKKKYNKKGLIVIGIGVVAIIALTLIVSLFSGKGTENYALYIKEGELFYNDFSKDPWQVSGRFINESNNYTDGVMSESGEYLGQVCSMSQDGELLFFPDRITSEDDGFPLYYRNIKKPKKDPVKIDSDVRMYNVNDSATVVTYVKGNDSILYQYDMKSGEKKKVDSDVEFVYYVNENGTVVVYLSGEDNTLYEYDIKADKKEKIDSEISSIEYWNDDNTTVFYVKEGTLYKKERNKDRVKISSDVHLVINVYESGEVYYLKYDSSEKSLMDYVVDDMKDTDATITEPTRPEYPFRWDFDTDEEFSAAREQYEIDSDTYEIAYDNYIDKLNRDGLRERLENNTISQESYTLCYYNGKEEEVLTDAFVYDEIQQNYYFNRFNSSTPVISFEAYNQSTFEKANLSEVQNVYEVEDMVDAALFTSVERYVSVGSDMKVFEQTAAKNIKISDDGKLIYYVDDVPEGKSYGDLYKVVVSGKELQKAELYDSDVYVDKIDFIEGNKIMYFKDVSGSSKGELYFDKTKIDYDVKINDVYYNEESKQFIYYTDWNNEKDYGTLKIFKKGKAEKVYDDVHRFSLTPEGEVLFLYDYSMNSYKGDLYMYKNGKSKKIDEEVVTIFSYDGEDRGGYIYGW